MKSVQTAILLRPYQSNNCKGLLNDRNSSLVKETNHSNMSEKMLDQNGELLPGTSGLTDSDKEISAVEESSLLESSDDELESDQRSPIRKRSPTRKRRVEVNHQQENPSERTRYNNSTEALAKKISKSEESIRKLKAHAEKKTCPKSLRYNVRVACVTGVNGDGEED